MKDEGPSDNKNEVLNVLDLQRCPVYFTNRPKNCWSIIQLTVLERSSKEFRIIVAIELDVIENSNVNTDLHRIRRITLWFQEISVSDSNQCVIIINFLSKASKVKTLKFNRAKSGQIASIHIT